MRTSLLGKFQLLALIFIANNSYAANTIKEHHKESGLSCDDCHISKPFESVETVQCLTCHELPERKTDYHHKPDKHDSPHYGPSLDCENCHFEHEDSVNFCNDCHEFDFKTP
ncbi:cytochrome c3 family protein [Shewanella atlantica]|uniref:cytochrome c3 family protein n=1 Tax=Shewanella atlantica TaxID=271099 RepID=UPI0037370A63